MLCYANVCSHISMYMYMYSTCRYTDTGMSALHSVSVAVHSGVAPATFLSHSCGVAGMCVCCSCVNYLYIHVTGQCVQNCTTHILSQHHVYTCTYIHVVFEQHVQTCCTNCMFLSFLYNMSRIHVVYMLYMDCMFLPCCIQTPWACPA